MKKRGKGDGSLFPFWGIWDSLSDDKLNLK